jgi:hypothetical protein
LDNKLCGTVHWNPDQNVFPVSCGGRKGQFVKITQKNDYLTLAEVQVFGTTFGIKRKVPYGKYYLAQTGSKKIAAQSKSY